MSQPIISFDIEAIRAQFPARRVEWLNSVDSTMLTAAQMARKGNARGAIVGAEEQTAGMGRHGRKWHSAPGEGLYVSMVLDAKPAPILMLALGLAAQEAIKQTTNLAPDLRWPNDVLLRDASGVERKCAGMLAQVERDAVIAGIGINVSQSSFPDNLDTPATSLLMEDARVRREDLLIELVDAVDYYCGMAADAITRKFVSSSSYANGKQVKTEVGGQLVTGVTCGLDTSGFLRIKDSNGAERIVLAGGVRPV
jgi:BirA family biotin operon repressor/biotin-[acetyl-CoA-carboxylase] ligase